MPRFVILRHDHPHLHWDFMLETGPVLRTWRLEHEPIPDRGPISAMALGVHRLIYLEYEGPVSGGRGTVTRWDAGDYLEEDARDEHEVRVRLLGKIARGHVLLERKTADEWSFTLSEAIETEEQGEPWPRRPA